MERKPLLHYFLNGSSSCGVKDDLQTCFDEMMNKIEKYFWQRDEYQKLKTRSVILGFRCVFELEIEDDKCIPLPEEYKITQPGYIYKNIFPFKTCFQQVRGISQQTSQPNTESIVFNVINPVVSFTGSFNELKTIHKQLNDERSNEGVVINSLVSVVGLGGLGKSETARRYVQEYKKYYQHII